MTFQSGQLPPQVVSLAFKIGNLLIDSGDGMCSITFFKGQSDRSFGSLHFGIVDKGAGRFETQTRQQIETIRFGIARTVDLTIHIL